MAVCARSEASGSSLWDRTRNQQAEHQEPWRAASTTPELSLSLQKFPKNWGFVVPNDGDSVKAAFVPTIRGLRHIVAKGDNELSSQRDLFSQRSGDVPKRTESRHVRGRDSSRNSFQPIPLPFRRKADVRIPLEVRNPAAKKLPQDLSIGRSLRKAIRVHREALNDLEAELVKLEKRITKLILKSGLESDRVGWVSL